MEKYVAGEQRVPVRIPAIPDGYRGETFGTMGELATTVFLEQCAGHVQASGAARDWGGDAFVAVSKEGADGLLWSTAWDDALAAARFARALEARRDCKRSGPKPPFLVVREGPRVAFVQGLGGEPERRQQAELLFSLVGEPLPPQPPLPTVPALRIRPPVATDFAARGRLEVDWFVDDAIGVRAPLGGLSVVPDPRVDLAAVGPSIRVVLASLWAPPSEAFAESVVAQFVHEIAKRGGVAVLEDKAEQVKLSWTPSLTRTLRIGAREEQRLVLVPLCDGKTSLLLFAKWDPRTSGKADAEAWMNAVRSSGSSPACEAMKSLRDPEKL